MTTNDYLDEILFFFSPSFLFCYRHMPKCAVLYTTLIRFIIPSQIKHPGQRKMTRRTQEIPLSTEELAQEKFNELSITRNANPSDPSPEVVIEPLERVSNEGQAHLGTLLLLNRASSSLLSLDQCCVIGLINLIRGEVSRVDVGSQARLERRPNTAKTVKLDTAEE